MQLADFIRTHHEDILREWESFARTLLPAAQGMGKRGLRDHADEILTEIVADMQTIETAEGALKKSRGRKEEGPPEMIGQVHAAVRVDEGFTLPQVVAEYRALRASVLRLWDSAENDLRGVLRFNEAIDEALTEAVERYTEKMDLYRDQLIGIVSHDLRTPLSGILLVAGTLTHSKSSDELARIESRIEGSVKRMDRIVGDLLDLTQTRLGSGISIFCAPADLGTICKTAISEFEGSHSKAVIGFTAKGDLRGNWDADRLAQILANLVGNAVRHGDVRSPISVVAQDDGEHVMVAVHNAGTTIPRSAWGKIFEPMVQHGRDAEKASRGLGLGLYIAKALATAHGGGIAVTSSDVGGTTFTVRLPRHAERVEATGRAAGRRPR